MEDTGKSSGLGAPSLPPWVTAKALGLKDNQETLRSDLISWLQGQSNDLIQSLLSDSPPVSNAAELMRRLVERLIEELPRETVHDSLRILSRLVQRRNAVLNSNVPLPEIPVRAPRPSNPFQADRWDSLKTTRRLRSILIDELMLKAADKHPKKTGPKNQTTEIRKETESERLARGRLLASAVLFGGLISRKSLESLYALLPNWPDHCEMAYGRLFVTWETKGANCRRWQPDALTALLLLSLPLPGSESSADIHQPEKLPGELKMEGDLRHYLRWANPDRGFIPPTVPQLLDAVRFDLELSLPRALTQYAAGELVSHSLNPKAWARLTGGRQPVDPTPQERTGDDDPEESNNNNGENDDGEMKDSPKVEDDPEPRWLSELRIAMGSKDHDKAIPRARKDVALLRGKSKNASPAANIFTGFAQELIEQNDKARKRSVLATLRTRLVAVATRLPGLVRLEDAASLNGDTLQHAYQQILEDAVSENQRQKLAGHLRAFHRYLVKTRMAEKINENEAFASIADDLPVDANIIFEDEYLKACDQLLDQGQPVRKARPGSADIRRVARLVLTLGFRCGLRRMEALKLQLIDLNEQDPAELLIRPWEQRRLKTPNATRKLPLYALLNCKELEELRKWKSSREIENQSMRTPSPFLFSIPSLDYTFLPEGLVFPIIHDALRQANDDGSLHFHHLRHSLASFITFALMRPPKCDNPQWLQLKFPEANQRLSGSSELHQALYGNSFPTRRHLFAVSGLLGHSSPEMSVGHYIHLMDQLLALWLEFQMPRFPAKVWLAAYGRAASNGYRDIDIQNGLVESGFWTLVARRYKELIPCDRMVQSSSGDSPTGLQDQQEEYDFHPFDHLWALLYLHAMEHLATEDLAKRFGFSTLLVEMLIEAANATEKQSSRKGSFRQREKTNAEKECVVRHWETNDKGKRIPCPRKPREGRDKEFVNRYAIRIWELLQKNDPSRSTVLKHFVQNYQEGRNGLEFAWKRRILAARYVKFLRALTIPKTEWRFGYYASEEQWDAWRSYLKLEDGPIAEPVTIPFKKKTDGNFIGIKVVPHLADQQSKTDERASYGMHYLMTMAAIWSDAKSREACELAKVTQEEGDQSANI